MSESEPRPAEVGVPAPTLSTDTAAEPEERRGWDDVAAQPPTAPNLAQNDTARRSADETGTPQGAGQQAHDEQASDGDTEAPSSSARDVAILDEPARRDVVLGEEGFQITSGGQRPEFLLEVEALIQVDARVYFGNSEDAARDDIVLRRVRPRISGTLYGLVDFKLRVDFGEGDVELTDAAIDVHPLPWLRLLVGKFSPPLGLERLQSNASMPMTEAALDANLSVSRDVGGQLWGEIAGGVVLYQLAVLDGAPDGKKLDVDEGKHKDGVGRLLLMPFALAPRLGSLGLGFAASIGRRDGTPDEPALGSYKTPGQARFFAYASSKEDPTDTVYANGRHTRLNPELFYFFGGFGVLAEAVQSSQMVHRGRSAALLTQRGAHVTGAFVLGGRSTYGGAKLNHPWNPRQGHLGALELDVRYGLLRVDPRTFPEFAEPWTAARAATSLGATLQWIPSRLFRYLVSFERTTFVGGAGKEGNVLDRAPELALIVRCQLSL